MFIISFEEERTSKTYTSKCPPKGLSKETLHFYQMLFEGSEEKEIKFPIQINLGPIAALLLIAEKGSCRAEIQAVKLSR